MIKKHPILVIIVLICYCPVSTMHSVEPRFSFEISASQQIMNQDQSNALLERYPIYGVRWMLGNAYSGLESYVSNQYYIVLFNSVTALPGNLILSVSQLPASCSSVDIPSATIYKCIVTQDLAKGISAQVPYQIIQEVAIINDTQGNDAKIYLDRRVIFSGIFKPIGLSGSLSMLFIGSWDVYNEEWRQTVQSTLDSQAASLILTTGNFLPELRSDNPHEVLRLIEGITSRVALLSSNSKDPIAFFQQGNTASFYSPQWEDYQNFLSLARLHQAKVAILSFDPPELSSQQSSNLDIDFQQVFQSLITNIKSQFKDKNYSLIALSPFSFYCSQESSCPENKMKLEFYEQQLSTTQLSLYLSGSANGYERTHGLCPNGSIDSGQAGFYDLGCTIYVNEGPLTLDTKTPNKETFSAYRSLQPGIGVISILSQSSKSPNKVIYHHLDTTSTSYQDSFTMGEPTDVAQVDTFQQTAMTIIVATQYVFLLFVVLYIVYSIVVFQRKKRIDSASGHIEMVEEVNPQVNQLRNSILQ